MLSMRCARFFPFPAPWAAAIALVAAGPTRAAPQDRPDQRSCRADYAIEAAVDDATRALDGAETIVWTNRSGEPVGDLWFHLYLNSFANNRSTRLEESGGTLWGGPMEDAWGWQRVESVRVSKGGGPPEDVTSTLRYEQPDGGSEEDRTVCRVDLPWTAGPGEEVTIQLEWSSLLPRLRSRCGVKDDFIFAAHWFPQLGVYQAGRGWNCHEFHKQTEFFSDYGTYDVTLTLPAKYRDAETDTVKVGGSGVLHEHGEVDGKLVVRFLAPSLADRERADEAGRTPLVHGFAWTADPDFVVQEREFSFRQWADREANRPEVERVHRTLERDREDVIGRDVTVRLLIQPEHAGQLERHFEATCATLFFYGLWFGAYPYEMVSVVDPPWNGQAAGGMEYPTLFTCGTRLYSPPSTVSPEGVTIHECGHQFWYGLVGNNEAEASWMDEGFNSFVDSEVALRQFGPRHATTRYFGLPVEGVMLVRREECGERPGPWDPRQTWPVGHGLERLLTGQRIPIPWTDYRLRPLATGGLINLWRDHPYLTLAPQISDQRWADRSGMLEDHPQREPVMTAAWRFADRRSYRKNSYERPAVILRSLPGVVGHDRFLKGMRHYSEKWRYGHPAPEDFFEAFIEGSGEDVSWYFEELLRGTGTVDWAVTVEQRPARPASGLFQETAAGEFAPRAAEEARPPSGEAEPELEEPWAIEVAITRTGDLRLPLEIEIQYEDDAREQLTWSRQDQLENRWLKIARTDPRRVVAVRLDPSRDYYIDPDMSNNQWFEEVDRVAPLRWSERVFSQIVQYLHWYSAIGG